MRIAKWKVYRSKGQAMVSRELRNPLKSLIYFIIIDHTYLILRVILRDSGPSCPPLYHAHLCLRHWRRQDKLLAGIQKSHTKAID